MDERKLWFVLLLPLCLCLDMKGAIVKTIGSKPDVTRICTTATLHSITLIVCKIRTERSREECRLLYRHGHDFVHECDSRFTLVSENQTVFLRLTNLIQVDSGSYTCECSYAGGTDTLHLIITVTDDEAHTPLKMLIYTTVISSGTGFLIVTGVVFGFVLRKKYCRGNTRSGASSSGTLRHLDQGDTYASLQQEAIGIYHTITTGGPQQDEADPANLYATISEPTGGKEEDISLIYSQ